MPGVIDAPGSEAGETAVCGAARLDASGSALRTEAACVEPVAVTIERFVDALFGNRDRIIWGKCGCGVLPSITLHGEKLDVAAKILMRKAGMADFMEDFRRPTRRGVGDGLCLRMPAAVVTGDELKLREVGSELLNERVDRGHSSSSHR